MHFTNTKKHLLLIPLLVMATGCSSVTSITNKITSANNKNTSKSGSKLQTLTWAVEPGKTGLEDFNDIALISPINGYGAYAEQNGYGTSWIQVNSKDLVGGDKYSDDAIIGIRDGKKKIYNFEDKALSSSTFSTINRDDILGMYVFDEDLDSNNVNYFDKNFDTHTTVISGVGGDIAGDYAVYANGYVFYYADKNVTYDQYAPDNPAILPAANSYTMEQQRELGETEKPLNTPDYYVILQKGKEPVKIPDGMTPAYYSEVITTSSWDPKDYLYNTSFVNGIVKLLDSEGQLHLWNYNTQSFLSNQPFEDATFCEDHIIGVEKDDKWAFMDDTGKLLTDYIFDKVSAVHDGKAYVVYNDRVGILKIKAKSSDSKKGCEWGEKESKC